MALAVFGPDADLFTVTPARARRTDPAESHAAAARITGDGLTDARRMALNLIRLNPGLTCPELAHRALIDGFMTCDLEQARQRIGRRLSELNAAGLIERCAEVRRGCATWRPRGR